MFVDDINLFFTYQDIRYLFQIDSKPRIRKHQPMVCFKWIFTKYQEKRSRDKEIPISVTYINYW